jgi:hypothetical protein
MDETQQQTADAVGCSQQMVAKIDRMLTTKSCETHAKVVVPDWITDPHQQANFRKLTADERARLEAALSGDGCFRQSDCRRLFGDGLQLLR